MRLLLLVLALVLLADSAEAQRRGHRGIAEQGDLAIAVGFSGLSNFFLRPIEGGIGLRYRAADQTVLGGAVAIGGEDATTEADPDLSERGEVASDVTEVDRRNASLSLWVEQHVGTRRSTVSPFVGAGIRIATGSWDSVRESTLTCPADAPGCFPRRIEETYENETTAFGGGLILGGEVKIVNGVTLSGAYTLGVEYSEQDSRGMQVVEFEGQEDQESGGETHREGWRYGVGTTQVALSIYF